MNLYERLRSQRRIDVFRAVKDLRDLRPKMIDTLVISCNSELFHTGPALREGRGACPSNRHAWPPNYKLSLFKTAAFVLNFKFWPPLINAWPPNSTALAPALTSQLAYQA